MRRIGSIFLLTAFAIAGCSTLSPPIEAVAEPAVLLDHMWIAVPPGAPEERKALETAGFRIAPTINRHVGQGTASATVEFENGYLELVWPDDSVPVTNEGGARANQRFVERMNWRTSGTGPFGIALRRTATTPAVLPFETWEVRQDWMEPGNAMVIMTPRGSRAINIALHPHGTDEAANLRLIAAGGSAAAMFLHPNEARRITTLRITADGENGLPPSAEFVRAAGAVELRASDEWLMELTLDDNRLRKERDFRPTLPLIMRW